MLKLETTGLPNVYLDGGYQWKDTSEGRALVIPDIPGLYAAIGDSIAHKHDLTGAEVKFLRKRLELSQADLAAFLRVSEQTVSLWERGKVEIPSSQSLLLRVLYLERMQGQPSAWQLAQNAAPAASDRLVFRQTEQGWAELAVA